MKNTEAKKTSPKKSVQVPEKKKRNAVCGSCQKPGHNARTCGK